MTYVYHDTWPETPRLLWRMRHRAAGEKGFAATQRICPTCGHWYSPQQFRAHLRSEAHAKNKGWWRT